MNQKLRELLCVFLFFGHEYIQRGNQYGTQLKCRKCNEYLGHTKYGSLGKKRK